MSEYQRCTRCVMDNTSDETIKFDENGYCNYCTQALNDMKNHYFPNEEGKKKLEILIERLKQENKNKKYDCIMGISGGLDSSYLAYLGADKWGLKILAVHVDDGYDTEISKNNISKLINKTNIDLEIIKPDEKQFNELTRAFILARVPNLAIPQDNILFANIYKFMKKNSIKTFLSGGNFALECILQKGKTHDAYDVKHIKDINKKFGREKIDKLDFISNLKKDIDRFVLHIESPRPLDFIDYNRENAFKELNNFCGFEYYGSKHLENKLTKFIQTYWFYYGFNVDKRTSHYSSMIVSNQLSRENAIKMLNKPLYEKTEMEKELQWILEKLDITKTEFAQIMNTPPKEHNKYATSNYVKIKKKLKGNKN